MSQLQASHEANTGCRQLLQKKSWSTYFTVCISRV